MRPAVSPAAAALLLSPCPRAAWAAFSPTGQAFDHRALLPRMSSSDYLDGLEVPPGQPSQSGGKKAARGGYLDGLGGAPSSTAAGGGGGAKAVPCGYLDAISGGEAAAASQQTVAPKGPESGSYLDGLAGGGGAAANAAPASPAPSDLSLAASAPGNVPSCGVVALGGNYLDLLSAYTSYLVGLREPSAGAFPKSYLDVLTDYTAFLSKQKGPSAGAAPKGYLDMLDEYTGFIAEQKRPSAGAAPKGYLDNLAGATLEFDALVKETSVLEKATSSCPQITKFSEKAASSSPQVPEVFENASSGPQIPIILEKAAFNGLRLPSKAFANAARPAQNIWKTLTAVTVQGGSLKTFSISDTTVERVQLCMKTEGRPLNALVELWEGPDNTPLEVGVYMENGSLHRFRAVIETPRAQNTIAIRNTAPLELPLLAGVDTFVEDVGSGPAGFPEKGVPETIQGGALETYSFAPSVASMRVFLETYRRPLSARIELLQGMNNKKQVIEIYTEDGTDRPFCAVIDTPGTGNVVRILNTGPVEFPLTARLEPYLIDSVPMDEFVVLDGRHGRDREIIDIF